MIVNHFLQGRRSQILSLKVVGNKDFYLYMPKFENLMDVKKHYFYICPVNMPLFAVRVKSFLPYRGCGQNPGPRVVYENVVLPTRCRCKYSDVNIKEACQRRLMQ